MYLPADVEVADIGPLDQSALTLENSQCCYLYCSIFCISCTVNVLLVHLFAHELYRCSTIHRAAQPAQLLFSRFSVGLGNVYHIGCSLILHGCGRTSST